MKNYRFATVFATLFLVVYTILHFLGAPVLLLSILFIVSPLLIVWMVYTVIRYAPYNRKERDDEIPDDALRG